MNKEKTRPLVQDYVLPYKEIELAHNTDVINRKYPILTHKIDQLRSCDTTSSTFRSLIEEISMIEMIESTRRIMLEDYEVETPICKMVGQRATGKKMVLAPIVRAGLGMEPAIKRLFPQARTGHIGITRDKVTLESHEYLWRMPKQANEREVYVLDPMLATGGTADLAISKLKECGFKKNPLSVHYCCSARC